MEGSRPTIADVARKAGVSTATVSRVLNNQGLTKEEVRNRVHEAVRLLNYDLGKLRTKNDANMDLHMLPILMPNMINPFYLEIAQGIQDECEKCDLFPVLIHTTHNTSRQQEMLRKLKTQPIKGVIVCGNDLHLREWEEILDDTNLFVVMLNDRVQHPNISCILVNNELAATQATQHLLSLEHKRIAYLGEYDQAHSDTRRRGVKKALEQSGLSIPPECDFPVSSSADGFSHAVSRLLMLPHEKRPTAVIIYNDFSAINVLTFLRKHDISVPADISVISFDNIPMAAHSCPSLTTVDIPKYRMGKLAVQTYQDLLSGRIHGGSYTMLEAPIIIRESIGPAPK